MQDYTPLPFGELCNAGLDRLPAGTITTGLQPMRGIPFSLGDDPDRCLLLLGSPPEIATLEVRQQVRWTIVAHCLLASDLDAGAIVGEVAAEYTFELRSGRTMRVPIRERFEIGVTPHAMPESWGQLPFLALPDRFIALPHRSEGSFARTGSRWTEMDRRPFALYL